MEATYSLVEDSRFVNQNIFKKLIKNKFVVGLAVFLFAALIYFVSLNFIDPADTNIQIEEISGKTNDKEPVLKETLFIDVSGAVKKPGVYRVESGARIIDALNKANGILETSNEKWVTQKLNLAAQVSDQQKIYVPFEWEDLTNKNSVKVENLDLKEDFSSVEEKVSENKDLEDLINVNSASDSDLRSLSGIGEVYSGYIIKNRPYEDLEDLENKTQIPQSTINKIKIRSLFNEKASGNLSVSISDDF